MDTRQQTQRDEILDAVAQYVDASFGFDRDVGDSNELQRLTDRVRGLGIDLRSLKLPAAPLTREDKQMIWYDIIATIIWRTLSDPKQKTANVQHAAEITGLGERTIWRWMDRFPEERRRVLAKIHADAVKYGELSGFLRDEDLKIAARYLRNQN